jgi:integrase/recombinase XerD
MRLALYLFTNARFENLVKQNLVKEATAKQDIVNWQDPALQRWFGSITRQSTKYNYRTAFRTYTLFTGMTASALIDEALEDAKRDVRARKDVVLTRLVQFYNWLKTDYEKKSRGKGEHVATGKGVSDKLASAHVGAVRSFYATFGVTVRLKGRHKLPKPRVKNKRMKIAAEQVKLLVDHARTPRDRAVILTMFQSGMDVSTLCSLKYSDVSEGLTANEHPLKLSLYRPKTGIDYYTFIGKDAVEALKAYINDMKNRGVQFKPDTPLFMKERGKEPLETNLVQNMMAEVARKCGLVDRENNGKSFNPLSPHALRESFGSIMINSGVPDTIVDFWLGHEIGEMAEAYKSVQFESLKQMYLERERLLSVSAGKVDVEELKAKVRGEVEQQSRQLQTLVNSLATENIDLKRRIQQVEEHIASIEKLFKELKQEVGSLAK